jgi:dTDP-6-deoxy-L-talose 4-dehydrogenase (NAD+)
MSKVVLLTGGTGFVGTQLINVLRDCGASIRLVLRKGSQLELTEAEEVIFTENIFLESSDWWRAACQGVDVVIHAAWYAEPGEYLMSAKNLDCLSGTLALAKGALEAKVRRFIGIGTCFEYDLTEEVQSLNTPLNPLTPYAAAKTSVYLFLSQYFKESNVGFVWCRLFYLFGDNENVKRLVPYLHDNLSAGKEVDLTHGNQIRDFMNVYDAAREIVEISQSNYSGAANICSGAPISIRNLAIKIADIYGRRDLLIFGSRKVSAMDPPSVVGVPHFCKSSKS